MDKNAPKIAVLGAGVVGMTVAKMIQEELKDSDITIIADKLHDDTTSAINAGIFRPSILFRGPTQEITKKWVADSWYYWQDILKSLDAPKAGIMSFPAYVFSNENEHAVRNHLIEHVVPIYRPAEKHELQMCGGGWKYGSYYTTLSVNCERYLPWVEEQFIRKGGKIVKDQVHSFTSLNSKFDLVFNCTGMGAKFLCNDHNLVPVRGQVVKVRAPWLKTAFDGEYDTYAIPGIDGIATLGRVRQYNCYDMKVSKSDAGVIFERCCQLLPELRNAEIVGHKVGLRPHRTPVRVEPEFIDSLKVVHCYGHGGHGVTCAPGTGMHAVKIGIDLLKSNLKQKL